MPAEHGGRRAERLAGEGVVYGISEGLLQSTLPALMAWEMVHTLGWSGVPGTVARPASPSSSCITWATPSSGTPAMWVFPSSPAAC